MIVQMYSIALYNYVLGFLYLYIIHVCFLHIRTNTYIMSLFVTSMPLDLKKEIFTNPELQSRYLFISIENVLVCVQ